jgi:tetratricopeptide (TPR) repeat protein
MLAVAVTAPMLLADGAQSDVEPPKLEALDRIDARGMMDLLCDGRSDSVLAILNSPPYRNSGDPMVHLLISRALRDQLADEDDDKDQIEADAKPIMDSLDRAIAICDKALDQSSADPIYRYYRGRAWLGKAQIHTLTRSYWGAGRSAARAKGDLEEFLKIVPDHPGAQGDLGAFLYFADTLPGVVKFLSKLLFIPGGDRDRGLRMIEYAATHEGVFMSDYQVAIAAIYLLFEGRLEDGAVEMRKLIERYPYYTRLVEPFGVLAPLYPTRLREFQRLEDEVVRRHMSRGSKLIDWSLVKRIRLHRTYSNMFFGQPQMALPELTSIVENPAPRPDWLLPLAIINRGHLYAKRGETETAKSEFERVLANDKMKHFHDLASGLVRSLDTPWATVDLADLAFVGSIYDGDLRTANDGISAYDRKYGRDVLYYFYLGELKLFEQDFVAAARAYADCLEIEVYGGDQTYQMFSALRLGEIHGHENRYDMAADYIDKAAKYSHAGFLFDFLLHSRKRFYELLDNGTIDAQPTLLIEQSMSQHTPPLSTN